MSNHDLISRSALIKAVEQKHFAISDNTHPYEAIRIQGKYFREVVDRQPVVDAVKVVRCKDCKNKHEYTPTRWFCGLTGMPIDGDGFCSHGEYLCNFCGAKMDGG